ncbi:putative virion protein [Lumpy skin disease virus]|uniref:Putative virion protein n=1 Tax=Lumpy skin disease virus TaxID=59509 RepID=Q91MT2_LSDV|nr:hypothetical protein LSDVgp080 [Lumpy skin disease virus NI-2490]AAN02648.1 putative virion protein [Lumpy skin disease virus NW-LW]AOE47656.1 hypothetical protein [Lumpy skin disease virus]AAK85041.1 LSDV080 putative virion protein [Lumpy skin disease virus NI-2490]ARO77388.1 putative virion protein [Lumpy skin disease virus]ART89406.1 putative virion protein [Lumpy skin disease virus]
MESEIKRLTNIIKERNIICPIDIEKIYNEKFLLLEKGLDETLYAIHIYDSMARFDNGTFFKIAKFLYRNDIDVLKKIFIDEKKIESTNALLPTYSVNIIERKNALIPLTEIPNGSEGILLILLHLFNSFKFNKLTNISTIPYYLPFGKYINNIII